MALQKKSPNNKPLTRGEVDLWQTLEALAGVESFLDWVPIMSPTFTSPRHLVRLAEVLVRSQFEPVYCWISVPPRHSKTESLVHYVPWRLHRDPTTEIAYCTYEANLAYTKSRRMREMAEQSGVQFNKSARNVKQWETVQGGKLIATGVGGPITGKGAKLLIIDDPIKNREEAESPVIRQKVWDWFTSTAMTRVEPGGSVIVCHTRWHDDDLIGRIISEFPTADQAKADPLLPMGWEGISFPAIDEWTDQNGVLRRKALWPERWPLAELDKKRRLVGEYDWAALYQGQPRPKGGRMFRSPQRYDLPMIASTEKPYKIIIGADPAATEKTSADYSVAVVMACSGEFNTLSFHGDILEVVRGQMEIPAFVARLRDLAVKWGAPIAVEAVAGFKAVPQMLRNLDKRLTVIEAPALGDKFTRALPVAAAWNDQRIRIPHKADWCNDFLREVEKFTGVKDAHDDQVDALAHAYNSAQMIMPQVVYNTPTPIKSNLPFG